MKLSRRGALRALIGAATTLTAAPAFAGSYLNRAALLLHEGRKEADYLRAHFADKELARIIHRLATARVEVASAMMVPKEVVQAHPHLLLVFESYERAADAAENGQAERFLVTLQRALDEERTFRVVLKQLGWEVPGGPDRDRDR
ncbi:MAG: hypothetical protein QM756_29070 [Polyangiaceae bacterium]